MNRIVKVTKRKRYQVVYANNRTQIERLLDEGWELYGFPVAQGEYLYQALITTEDLVE